MNGLIGRKLGMTRVFDAAGTHVPVTVIEAGPCAVISVAEGRAELGFGAKKAKRTPKALAGHVKKAGVETAPRVIRRFAVTGEAPAAGSAVTVAIFAEGDRVKVRRTYLDQFGKVLPGKKVVRFYQIENKMDAILRYDLAGRIPVVEQ